jgi:hypothetical protein
MKTAEELGLEGAFYNGLVKLLGLLKEGQLPGRMNMGVVLKLSRECGTVGCILGWGAFLGGMCISGNGQIQDNIVFDEVGYDLAANFASLVTPHCWTKNPYTEDEITHALETYLYTGMPEWPSREVVLYRCSSV